MATRNPRYERQHHPEDDEDKERASDLEVFIAQKNGERAAVKEQSRDQDEIPGRRLGADCNIMHLFLGCMQTSPWIQMTALRFDSCFWRVFHVTKMTTILARCDF